MDQENQGWIKIFGKPKPDETYKQKLNEHLTKDDICRFEFKKNVSVIHFELLDFDHYVEVRNNMLRQTEIDDSIGT